MFAPLRFLLVALAIAITPQLNAQSTNGQQGTVAAGPRIDATATGVRRLAQPSDSAATMQQRRPPSMRKPVILMVVGGAAIVLGAVIGDAPGKLFMVGGAAAVLIGLYQYLH